MLGTLSGARNTLRRSVTGTWSSARGSVFVLAVFCIHVCLCVCLFCGLKSHRQVRSYMANLQLLLLEVHPSSISGTDWYPDRTIDNSQAS